MSDRSTAEQQRAIDCRERDILLEAGAGTGKTRTTVKRYASLLGEEVPPSRIMVFTFTEKAANELRERVRAEVSKTEGETISMSTAWIGTFHSICASILRAHPMEAEIDPSFTILDDIQSSLLKGESYDRALSSFMDSEERERLVSRFSAQRLRAGISNAFEQLRSRGQIRPKMPVPKKSDPARTISDLISKCVDGHSAGVNSGTIEKIEGIENYLQETPTEKITYADFCAAAFSSGSKKIPDLLAAMDRCRGVLAEVEFGEEIRVALAELLEHYADSYTEAKRSANLLDYEDLQLETLDLLTNERSAAVGARYRDQFTEIMVDEFQDTNQLQLNLIEALRGEDTRLFTVGDEMQAIYGFRHADVRLFRDRRTTDGVERLGLTANFRSEPAVIGAINEIGEKLDEMVKADRGDSDADEAGLRHEFIPLKAGLERVSPGSDQVEILFTENEGWAEFDLGPLSPGTDPEAPGTTSTEGSPEAEALLLAHHIKLTLDETGIAPSESAVLFKTKARMSLVADALVQVGLKPYIIGGTGFWDSREGLDLRSLLAVVANPLDDESLIAALTGPACGLSTDALFLLRRSAGSKNSLWPALSRFASGEPEGSPSAALASVLPEIDRKRAQAFVEAIDSIRGRAAMLPLGELVEQTVTATGYDLVSLMRDPEAAGLANIKRIASLAAGYESNEGRDLRGFLEWASLSADLDAEDAVATQEEESEVVRLMTIHKAKGLEFDLVCLADLGRGRNNSGETVFWIGPDPDDPGRKDGELLFGLSLPEADGSSLRLFDWTTLSDGAKRERTDEELRLFHVGLTRAKRRLVLSGALNLESVDFGESKPLAVKVAAALGIDAGSPEEVSIPAPELLSGETAAESSIRVLLSSADQDQERYLRTSCAPPEAAKTVVVGKPPLWRPDTPAFPNVPLSFTALSEFRECPVRFYSKRILRLREPEDLEPEVPESGLSPTAGPEEQVLDARDDGTRFGSAVHELLESCAKRGWVPPTGPEIENRLKHRGIDLADGKQFTRAKSMVSGFLESDLGLRAQAAACGVEVPLLVEVGRVTVRGFADLLIDDSDQPLVLDYKTNRLNGKAPGEKMPDYALQRDLYALAVQRARGIKSVEAAFVFLERPDEPVIAELGQSDLEAGRKALEEVVNEIELGHFFGGPEALFTPCGSCRACDRLASRITGSEAPR